MSARTIRRRARVIAVLTVGTMVVLASPSPASAAQYASSGERCTKVGTSKADKITGTSRKDVICGLGGNDVIKGLGGNDIIDAGSGNDRIEGGSGDDRLTGGSGNDTITGESGGDRILGREGNDDLSGGSGTDSLDGGPGTDWCTISAADTEKSCVYDKDAPRLSDLEISPRTVDVTDAERRFTARVRVVDDTGVRGVHFNLHAADNGTVGLTLTQPRLVSGTVRNGTWEATGRAPRYMLPGTYEIDADAWDRVGRDSTQLIGPELLRVKNSKPDKENAQVRDIKLSATTLDVREKDVTFTVKVRLTDDMSGVDDPLICLTNPAGKFGTGSCESLERYEGTARDGWWSHTSTIKKGSLGGDWNVNIWLDDQVHDWEYWYGPDVYRRRTADGERPQYHLLEGAAFRVKGTADNAAAKAVALKVDKTEIDTLQGPVDVNLYVRATDAAGEGVTNVGLYLRELSGTVGGASVGGCEYAKLHQGTRTDGWWRCTITFPQGTPPGQYAVGQVMVEDQGHWRSYAPPYSPHYGDEDELKFPAGSLTTTEKQPWDGLITVVENPAD